MSVQSPAPRPTHRDPATLPGTLTSLVLLVALLGLLVAFVLAPLALVAVGCLALLLARPRARRPSAPVESAAVGDAAPDPHGFGAGAR